MKKILQIAVDDGSVEGKITPPFGPDEGSKWLPGTILSVHDMGFQNEALWGDMGDFILAVFKNITAELMEDIRMRKKRIDQRKYLTDLQIQKLINNRQKIMMKMRELQESFPAHSAEWRQIWNTYKQKYQDEGFKPIWTKTININLPDLLKDTPEWQWVQTEEPA